MAFRAGWISTLLLRDFLHRHSESYDGPFASDSMLTTFPRPYVPTQAPSTTIDARPSSIYEPVMTGIFPTLGSTNGPPITDREPHFLLRTSVPDLYLDMLNDFVTIRGEGGSERASERARRCALHFFGSEGLVGRARFKHQGWFREQRPTLPKQREGL